MDAALFKVEREKSGLTLEEVSTAIGISKQAVHSWETGRRPIPLARQEQIKEIFSEPEKYVLKKRVFLVMCEFNNLMDYEDKCTEDYVCFVCSTREKAEEKIRTWVPLLPEGGTLVDNPSEVKTECGVGVYLDKDATRIVYTGDGLYTFTIREMEVD